ncbi:ubiquitin carboxyl-terminal hydrolase, putative [Entamoeba histolytica HM-3:IMSS]|uniref:Ubiquitin carboxyl-terminal hydrolase, putative n=2 Tax=Entamoeba histolytica TaxID=5759 RepID=M7X6I0_ENTHI|nr:ubiquitin carboxyl-terminal hydrolase, putative [Entamoeba histolytica HM-3:IMSS]
MGDVSQRYIDIIKTHIKKIERDDSINISEIIDLKMELENVNINVFDKQFANFYINESFPIIFAFIRNEEVILVEIFYNIFIELCIRYYSIVSLESKKLFFSIINDFPSIKLKFKKKFHEVIGMYTRSDQLSLIQSCGIYDYEIIEPFLSPNNVIEFNEIIPFIEHGLSSDPINFFKKLLELTKNNTLRKVVINFIINKVTLTEEMKQMIRMYKPNSVECVQLLNLGGDQCATTINSLLTDEAIEINYQTIGTLNVNRTSQLFILLYQRLVENSQKRKKTYSLLFILKSIVLSLEKECNFDGIDILIFLQLIQEVIYQECKEVQMEVLRYCLQAIKLYININIEDCFEYINELWILLVDTIAISFKDLIISFFCNILNTPNEVLLEYEIVAFSDKITEENKSIFDSTNGIDLIILLIEKIYKLEKKENYYNTIESLESLEWLNVLKKIMKNLQSPTAIVKSEKFFKEILFNAKREDAYKTLMNWIKEDPQIYYLRILQLLLRNEENHHQSIGKQKLEYTVLYNGKEYNVIGERDSTIEEILSQINGITELNGIDTLLTQQKITKKSTLGELNIPLTEIIHVVNVNIKEKLSNLKSKQVIDQKPIEQISQSDVNKLMEVCEVSNELATKALQMYHSLDKAMSQLLENKKDIELELNKDLSKIKFKGIDLSFMKKKVEHNSLVDFVIQQEDIKELFSIYDNGNQSIKQIIWFILMRLPTIISIKNEVKLLKEGKDIKKKGSELIYFLQTIEQEEEINNYCIEWIFKYLDEINSIEGIDLIGKIYGKYCQSNKESNNDYFEIIEKCVICIEKNAGSQESLSILESIMKMINSIEGSEHFLDGERLYLVLKNIIQSNQSNIEMQCIIPKISKLVIESLIKNNTFDTFLNKVISHLFTINQLKESTILSQWYLILCELSKILQQHKIHKNIVIQLIQNCKEIINFCNENFTHKEIRLPFCIKILEILIEYLTDNEIITISNTLIQKYIEDISIVSYPSRHAVIHFFNFMKVNKQNIFDTLIDIIYKKHPKKIVPLNELSSQDEHRHGHVGFYNHGATCYINSALQQLYNMKIFRDNILEINCDELKINSNKLKKNSISNSQNITILTNKNKRNLDKYNVYVTNKMEEEEEDFIDYSKDLAIEVIRQLQILFTEMSIGSKKTYSTIQLIESIQNYKHRNDLITIQHDTNDFINLLFDCIEEALKGSQIFDCFTCKFDDVISSLDKNVPYRKTHESESRELFLPLRMSVELSLESFFREEVFNGENMIKTDDGKYIVAIKQNKLKNAPQYLLLQLNRFSIASDHFSTIKNNEECSFNEIINLSQYGCNQEYQLIGVIVHIGSANAGHYFSFIKNEEGWLECNDSHVCSVPFNRVKEAGIGGGNKSSGYIFVYSRINKEENENIVGIKLNPSIEEERIEMLSDIIYNDVELLKVSIGSEMNLFVCTFILNIINLSREDLFDLIDPLLIELKENGKNIYANDVMKQIDITKCIIKNQSERSRIRVVYLCKWFIKNGSNQNVILFVKQMSNLISESTNNIYCLKQFFIILYYCFKSSKEVEEFMLKNNIIKELIKYIEGLTGNDIFNENYLPDLSSFMKLLTKTICKASLSNDGEIQLTKEIKENLLEEPIFTRMSQQPIKYISKILQCICQNNYTISLKLANKIKNQINEMKYSGHQRISYDILNLLKTTVLMDDLYNLLRSYFILNNIETVTISPFVPIETNEMKNGILTKIIEVNPINTSIISTVVDLSKNENADNVREVLFEMNHVLEDMAIHLLKLLKEKYSSQIQQTQIQITSSENIFLQLLKALTMQKFYSFLYTSKEPICKDLIRLIELFKLRYNYLKKSSNEDKILCELIQLKKSSIAPSD